MGTKSNGIKCAKMAMVHLPSKPAVHDKNRNRYNIFGTVIVVIKSGGNLSIRGMFLVTPGSLTK